MEITYHWEGDYLIPDLKISDTAEYQIGKYGRMRKRFWKKTTGAFILICFCRKPYGNILRRLMRNVTI